MHITNHEIIAFGSMLLSCFALTWHRFKIGHRRADFALKESRSVHSTRVPRTAGIAVLISILPTIFVTEGELRTKYVLFLLATTPIIIVSLFEDLISETRAVYRFLAIFCSNCLVVSLLGVWLTKVGIPGLNHLLSGYTGILITALIITGISNSFNLIDGLNGLCAGFSLCAFLAISLIAEKYEINGVSHISSMFVAIIFAFTLFNFPIAKIYLGDTGAYFLGFLYSWLGVAILNQSTFVKAPSFMLIAAYPISETIITVARRLLSRTRVTSADQLHFHHLALKIVEFLMPKVATSWRNPIASICIAPIYVSPMFFSYHNVENRVKLFTGFLVFFTIYSIIYILMRRVIFLKLKNNLTLR